jgi:hypothetical protein
MTTACELGAATVAMAVPSARLGLHGGEEGKGIEVEVSWWRRGALEACRGLTGGASTGVRLPWRGHVAAMS